MNTSRHHAHGIRRDHVLGYEIGAMIGMSDLAFYRWVKKAFGMKLTELKK